METNRVGAPRGSREGWGKGVATARSGVQLLCERRTCHRRAIPSLRWLWLKTNRNCVLFARHADGGKSGMSPATEQDASDRQLCFICGAGCHEC
eukprot:6178279-Pleurochrysis_carterae.AAC.1